MVQVRERESLNNPSSREYMTCCFVCGERKALWVLNSKVSSENKPFFPFLLYQKTPPNACALDINGRCLSCNVCYLFLMQQWNAYEINHTPILKRLYWLKRPADEYIDVDDADKDFSKNIKPLDTSSVNSTKIETFPNARNTGDDFCQICYSKGKHVFLKSVFTVPQKSSDIPFYPGLVKDGIGGSISVCVTCESKLLKQWLEFERKKVPLIDRNYTVSLELQNSLSDIKTCYLCEDMLSTDNSQPLFCKNVNQGPYYPFLLNLTVPKDAIPLNNQGFTFCCGKCKSFLKEQWDAFEGSNVCQEERVYRTKIEQRPLLTSSFNIHTIVACFICSSKSSIGNLKRIYCNSGANMNLGFLKRFPKNEDGFFCEETGETFVCCSCFEELKQHWYKYRASKFDDEGDNLPLHATDTCEICFQRRVTDPKLHFFPSEKEGKIIPYFPQLKKLRSVGNFKPISSCQLCAINLMKQWLQYEKTNIDLQNRVYRFDRFICYVCDSMVFCKDLYLAKRNNIKKDVKVEQSSCAVMIEDEVVVCLKCKQECFDEEQREQIDIDTTNKSESSKETREEQRELDMKATATVPPFLNFSVRNHHQEQANTVTTSAEGGFAAALRKLAQQAPGFPAPVSHREMRQKSPPTKNAEMISPVLLPHHSMHPGSYISGAPIMAPIPHSFPNSEKTELLMKSPYGHSHESHKELSSRPPVPGIFQFHEREEHHHHRSKERYELHARKPFEQAQFSSAASSAGVVLNSSLKERPSSSIGLVHPQPARKHHDEENNSSVMNSIHYNHRETAMRSLSPADIQRYAPFVGRHHSQSSQPSCPVHGHEPGHQHDEQACRPPGLNFDPARLPRDFALHAQHPRLREEIQLLQQHGRHPLERKDILQSHHALEEDLRRRGLDYRWGLPPHLLDETYRRHLLNGGHEHSGFKEPPHGLYLPPHFYYGGRDYPLPGDQYISHGLPSQAEMLHRHAPVSPRLLEYYRRGDHGFAERTTRNDVEAERRHEERREKERSSIPHTPSLESLKRKNEEIMLAERKRNDEEKMNRELVNNRPKLPFIKGLDYQRNTQKLNDKPLEANSIDSLLKLPDSKTELAAASILANMNRINQSPSSDDVESLNSSSGTENHSLKPLPPKLEETENDTEQSEEKLQYMLSLGLVSHSRKRVLEDDYDRKRWDRKFRKFRGRPKKRSKRENTEESSLNGDARPGSDLDFYSGPMTRHKQQLLQEQETLLEQIQKRHSIDTNEDNNNNNNNSNNEIHSETNNDSKHKNRKSPRNSPNKESRSPFVVSTDKNTTQLEEVNNSSRSNQFTLTSNHDNLSFNNRTHAQESKHSLEQSRLVTMLRDGNSYPQKPNKHERMYQRPQSSQHRDPVEEVKMLDNSLFGRLNEPHESYLRWCGVQQVSQSYAGYQAEYDAKRQQLLQSYEELQRENHNLRQKQNHLDKDMAVYNERRMRIAERRRHMHLSLEGIHHSLRTLSNL